MKKLISLLFVALISTQMWGYTVTITPNNCTYTAKRGTSNYSSGSSAYSGDKIKITATPNTGYKFFNGWTVSGISLDNCTQTTSGTSQILEFTMPSKSVTVTINFSDSKKGTFTLSNTTYEMYARDMGTNDNIYWGDRALGATSTTTGGFFCQYGYTDLSSSNYCSGSNSYSGKFTSSGNLPADKDVATAALGEGWRMPTRTEWNTLISKSTFSCASTTGNNVVLTANSKTITLYTADIKYNGSVGYSATSSSAYAYYWTSTPESTSSGTDAYRAKFSKSTNASNITKTTDDNWWVYGQQVIPVYDARNYTLTVKADGTTSTNYSGKWGAEQTVTASKTGYTFTKWDEDNNTTNPRTFKICDMTYTAVFTANKYNITYKDQGNATFTGTHASGYPTQHTYGSSTTLKGASKENYNFLGWYTNSDCSGSAVTSLGATAYTSAITLYAKWEANNIPDVYSIEYKDQGNVTYSGSNGNSLPDTHTDGTATDLVNGVKEGYTFDGWFIESDCSGTAVTTLGANDITDDVTLYAKWSINSYNLTWDVNGGDELTGDYTSGSTEYGTTIVAPNTPTKTGCTFAGWNPAFVANTTMPAQALTYTAQWTALPKLTVKSFEGGTVTLTAGGNTVTVEPSASDQYYYYASGTNITIRAIASTGYNFTGWGDVTTNPRNEEIAGDMTLSPTFAANVPFSMIETWEADDVATKYDFTNVLTVTLKADESTNRTFTAGQWATLSVPFNYTLTEADGALYNSVYAFRRVILSQDGGSVYIDFVRSNDITANNPYLVVPRQSISAVVFNGVKLSTPEEKSLSSDGKVSFVSNLLQQTITGNRYFYVGANSNLYYAKNAGTTIRGNRAYFHKEDGAPAPRRVRIMLDGVETEKEIAEDGTIEDVREVRKYMEDGRLVIECNGVRMDATGAKLN